MPALCSWSGGKDSALALYRASLDGMDVHVLLTMLSERGVYSRSHGTSLLLIQAQAQAMGKEIVFGSATWEGYEAEFIERLKGLKARGVDRAVFGDIDLEPHREWERRVSAEAGLEPFLPLWGFKRRKLVDEFINAGFRAVVVCVRGEEMAHWLGREFCEEFVAEAERLGWDACGEEGEFHTFVVDGPIFEHPVPFRTAEVTREKQYVFVPLLTVE